jgi:hypothetical protein
MNLVTPKAVTKLALSTKAEALPMIRFIPMLSMNLVSSKAAAKLILLFNRLRLVC